MNELTNAYVLEEGAMSRETYLGIVIDRSRDALLTDHAKTLLAKHYLRDGEEPQKGFARGAVAWSGGDMELAQGLYDDVSRLHFMFASPVLSNAPLPGETIKSLPISCFLNMPDDSIQGLNDHTVETRWLSVLGGGVGGHWNRVRSVSDKAPGVIPFLHTMDADMGAYQQGKVRRGSYAAYLRISHPDIEEFLTLRQPTGDSNRKCLGTGFHHGISVPNAFMLAVERNGPWPLVDPHDGTTRKVLSARKLWELVLETRVRTGEPYIFWEDTANDALPLPLKERGLHIHGSNLCSEIMLPTAPDRTAVCCLSSLNLEKWPEWRFTGIVGRMIRMLDNVLQHFIEHAPDALWRAKFSAERERSLGLGAMGWHALLQRLNTPFDDEGAVSLADHLHREIWLEAEAMSRLLGARIGEAPDMAGTGRRNAHLIAIAPNANSATIAATSPGIEIAAANAYTHRTRVGSHLVKNRYLEELLRGRGRDDEPTWKSIILNRGSVQHLDCLSPVEKRVFQTATEVDQTWIIRQAAARQKWIDQGQSVNLFFPPQPDRAYIHRVHMMAWKMGLKALYYVRAKTSSTAEAVSSEVKREKLMDTSEHAALLNPVAKSGDECAACQG